MGDFNLQPLSTSVQNLLNSQIQLCFILHGRNHAAYMTTNERADDEKHNISRESKTMVLQISNCQICKSVINNTRHVRCFNSD